MPKKGLRSQVAKRRWQEIYHAGIKCRNLGMGINKHEAASDKRCIKSRNLGHKQA
jgi:hypothetical protein